MNDRLIELARLQREVEAEISRLVRELEPRSAGRRRSRKDIPPCGTETGYQRHRYRGEDCDLCRLAHRVHNRQAEKRRKLVQK